MAKVKQKHLEGMEPPSIPSIDEAAEKYADLRDKRMAAGVKERDAKLNLMSLMGENGLDYYVTPGELTVRLTNTSGVKVELHVEEEGDDEGDDAE